MKERLRVIPGHATMGHRMTFSQMRTLLAVARLGNVTRAAEELHTTQPAVSHTIRNLEKELRVQLLVRRRNGVALTAIGQVVTRRAATILAQVEGLYQDVAAVAGERLGTLRIGAFPSATGRLLAPAVQIFRAAFPDMHVVMLEGSDGEVLDWIRTGAVDIGTVTQETPDLRTFSLTADEMVAVLPERHPLAKRAAVSIVELSRDPFIMSTGGCEPLIVDIARRGSVNLRRHYEVRDSGSIVAMVREGLGVSIMPTLAVPIDAIGISCVPFTPRELRPLMLAVLADVEPLPSTRTFTETTLRVIAESGLILTSERVA